MYDAETIENGTDAAREHADTDTYREAVAELARATRYDAITDVRHVRHLQ